MKRVVMSLSVAVLACCCIDAALGAGACPTGGLCDRMRCGAADCTCKQPSPGAEWQCIEFNRGNPGGGGGGDGGGND